MKDDSTNGCSAILPADRSEACNPAYLGYGDVVRVFGAAAVALIHVFEPFVKDPASIGRGDWWFCNFIVSWSRSAVPLFFMLSGALLLHGSKVEPIQGFYRKRLQRIGIPILFWSIFYLAYEACCGAEGLTLHEALKRFSLGQTYGHLYFLFAIAGLYLFTPVLWGYLQRATRNELRFGIVLIFVMLAAGNLASSFALAGWMSGTAFTKFIPYLGYFLAGYYLRNANLSGRAFALTCVLCLASIGLTMLGTSALYFRLDIERQTILYQALSPTMIITSVALFLIFGYCFGRQKKNRAGKRGIVSRLASVTMGVYLIHLWFVERVHEGVADWVLAWLAEYTHIVIARDWHGRVWLCGLLAVIVVLGISYTISFVIKRIPYVRRVIGL